MCGQVPGQNSCLPGIQPLWCPSLTLDLTLLLRVTLRVTKSRNWKRISNSTSNVAWIRFAKIAFYDVFFCQDFLKSLWIQSGYAKRRIRPGRLNKALEACLLACTPAEHLDDICLYVWICFAFRWHKFFVEHKKSVDV